MNRVIEHNDCLRNTLARKRVLSQLDGAWQDGRFFVPQEACDAKWLRRHARQAGVLEPLPGIFAREEAWASVTPKQREIMKVDALARAHQSWGFWGYDAALIWGLEVPNPLLGDRYIIQTRTPVLPGAAVHHCRPDAAGKLECVHGIKVTEFWRTVADCLLRAPFSFGLAIADSALRLTCQTNESLESHLRETCKGRRGVGNALTIARYANALSENGGESRFRAFFIVYGFEVPELQVEFEDLLEPDRAFRVDYLWHLSDGTLLIGELDGLEKYCIGGDKEPDVRAFADERQRESRLSLLGHRIIRFSFNELSNPRMLMEKLERAGVPRSPNRAEDWLRRWNG